MLLIDKKKLLNEVTDLNDCCEMYDAVASAMPIANPAIDVVGFRRELIRQGFSFKEIDKIHKAMWDSAINKELPPRRQQ